MLDQNQVESVRLFIESFAKERGVTIRTAENDIQNGYIFSCKGRKPVTISPVTRLQGNGFMHQVANFFGIDPSQPHRWPASFARWNRSRTAPQQTKEIEPAPAIAPLAVPITQAPATETLPTKPPIDLSTDMLEAAYKIMQAWKKMPKILSNAFLFHFVGQGSGVPARKVPQAHLDALEILTVASRLPDRVLTPDQIRNAIVCYINTPYETRHDRETFTQMIAEALTDPQPRALDKDQLEKRRAIRQIQYISRRRIHRQGESALVTPMPA